MMAPRISDADFRTIALPVDRFADRLNNEVPEFR